MTRYRCSNPECRSEGAFLAPEEVVAVPNMGRALYHAHERQGALLDPLTGLSNVARIGGPPDPYPLPCGPVLAIDGPCRVRLRRTKGYRKPPDAVNVARPTKWGNPFAVGEKVPMDDWRFAVLSELAPLRGLISVTPMTAEVVVEAYWRWIVGVPPLMLAMRDELAGRDLACWCRIEDACHASVLLALANPLPLTPEDLMVRMVEFESRAGATDGCL